MDSQDLFTNPEPEKKSGVPTWVWVVGGLGLCAILGICGIGGGLYYFAQTEGVEQLEQFGATLEALPTVEPSDFYHEEFNRIGDWGSGDVEDATVEGGIAATSLINDDTFEFTATRLDSYFWSTAEENFGNGTYEVDATAVGGPLNNGFGLMFMLSEDSQNFYLLEVSSDGFAVALYCEQICDEGRPLLKEGWFESVAVNQGLNQTNHLKVTVENGNMTFFVNDQQIGQASDITLQSGNIGIIVETFDESGVKVQFDNFIYNPIEE